MKGEIQKRVEVNWKYLLKNLVLVSHDIHYNLWEYFVWNDFLRPMLIISQIHNCLHIGLNQQAIVTYSLIYTQFTCSLPKNIVGWVFSKIVGKEKQFGSVGWLHEGLWKWNLGVDCARATMCKISRKKSKTDLFNFLELFNFKAKK